MLDRFKVPPEDEYRVAFEALRESIRDIFEAVGVPPDDAAEGASVLAMTDLRGVETHGVSNMLRRYLEWFQNGTLDPAAVPEIVRDFPAGQVIEGNRGLGIIQGPRAMRTAIEKARQVGVGVVTLRNSGHLGAVGHHAMIAAEHDMVGVCTAAAGPRVLPTFGAEPRLGTNPISYAAPTRRHPPVLFDVATTVLAENKLRLARRIGTELEPGWIADTTGAPVLDRAPCPEPGHYYQLPLGGTREHGSHKGYGLALMTEILGGILSGGVPAMLDPTQQSKHYFAAYDIASFSDIEQFKDTMDSVIDKLIGTPTAPGHERVLYPGLQEHEEAEYRREHGIPLHREVIEWMHQTTDELGIGRVEVLSSPAR